MTTLQFTLIIEGPDRQTDALMDALHQLPTRVTDIGFGAGQR